MFTRLRSFFTTLFTDLQTTFIWIFIIGILFCALMVAFGDEQNQSRFKTGLKICVAGCIVFLLARPIVQYIQGNL